MLILHMPQSGSGEYDIQVIIDTTKCLFVAVEVERTSFHSFLSISADVTLVVSSIVPLRCHTTFCAAPIKITLYALYVRAKTILHYLVPPVEIFRGGNGG